MTDTLADHIRDAHDNLKAGIDRLKSEENYTQSFCIPPEIHKAMHALSYAVEAVSPSPTWRDGAPSKPLQCECGFNAETCATNPCLRKKIHLAGMTPGSKWPDGAPIAAPPAVDRAAVIEALRPFGEIGKRLGWIDIGDDDRVLTQHVMEAPANDLAPGAVFCLMVGHFREAASVMRALADAKGDGKD